MPARVLALFLGLALFAPACATGAVASHMAPEALDAERCASLDALRGRLVLGSVGGGEETAGWDRSKVSDASLTEALQLTLGASGLLGDEHAAPLRLDVQLVELTQPASGYTMEVVAFVRYQLRARDERLLFDDVISASCTLDLDDAFMGSTRLRLASEGAVRRNLAAFQEALCAAAARGALGRG